MYIKYKVDNYIEGHKVSQNFAVWAQNDRNYNWSIIAKPFATKDEAISAAKEIAGNKPVLFGGYGV